MHTHLCTFMHKPGAVAQSVAYPYRKQWSCIRHGTFFGGKHNVPLALIEEERVVSHLRKNGYLILVNYPREACPGTKWLYVTDRPNMIDLSCLPCTYLKHKIKQGKKPSCTHSASKLGIGFYLPPTQPE